MKQDRPPAPFAVEDAMHPKPAIAPSWTNLRVDIAEIIGRFDKLEEELEQLRHGKLINEVMLEGGTVIKFERMPREELIIAKLSELHDAKDQLDRAQQAIAEKVAALSARDIGPRRKMLTPPRPKPAGDALLDKMEADLIELAKNSQVAAEAKKVGPPPKPPSVKVIVRESTKKGWFGRQA